MGLEQIDKDKYRLLHTEQQGLEEHRNAAFKKVEDLTAKRERRSFSDRTPVTDLARYLNLRPLQVEEILSHTKEGITGILEGVNEIQRTSIRRGDSQDL